MYAGQTFDSPLAVDPTEHIRQQEELEDKREDFLRKHLRRHWPVHAVRLLGVFQLLLSLTFAGVDLPAAHSDHLYVPAGADFGNLDPGVRRGHGSAMAGRRPAGDRYRRPRVRADAFQHALRRRISVFPFCFSRSDEHQRNRSAYGFRASSSFLRSSHSG